MSKCNLSVTVDGWQAMGDVAPTFRAGEPITGTVHVWVDGSVQCNGLDVELVPVRTTPGYHLGLQLPRVRVFEGTWEPGEYELRFSLPSHWLPTYRSKLGWKWVARATADIPWAIDPKGESEVVVDWPAPPTGVDVEPLMEEEQVQKSNLLRRILMGVALLGLLMIVSGGIGSCYVRGDSETFGDVAGAGLLIVLASMAGFSVLARGGRRQPTSRALDDVELSFRRDGGGYRSGAAAFIDCRAKVEGEIASVIARLVVEELAEWTTKENETTRTHRRHLLHHQQDVEMTAEGSSWRGSIPLPELDKVPPFSAGKPPGYGIVWKVDLLSQRRGKDKRDLTRRYLSVTPHFD